MPFLDEDRSKTGVWIHGIPVRCYDSSFRELAAQFQVQSILIAGSLDPSHLAHVTSDCRDAGVHLRQLEIAIRDLSAVPRRSIATDAGDRRDQMIAYESGAAH